MFFFRRQTEEQVWKSEKKKRTKNLDKLKKLGMDTYVVDEPAPDDGDDSSQSRATSSPVVSGTSGSAKKKAGGVKDVIADEISQLPSGQQRAIAKMSVPDELLNREYITLLKVLNFVERKKFRFQTSKAEGLPPRSSDTASTLPRFIRKPEQLWEPMAIKQATKSIKIGKALGEGAFGIVFEAKVSLKGHPGCEDIPKVCAIKILEHKTEKQKRANQLECTFLTECQHDNICRMYKAFQVGDEIWVLMELLLGGSLKRAMNCATITGTEITEAIIAYSAKRLLLAIKYLHDKQIAHRDLKNLNVMITTNPANIKIIDFGLACDVSTGPRVQQCGSPFWMAGEMIRGEPHSLPVDIWSFGICVLEMANGNPPNLNNKKRALFLSAMGPLPSRGLAEPKLWSSKFKDFLDQCQAPPDKRATAAALLEHKFITETKWEQKQVDQAFHSMFANALLVQTNLA